MQRQNLRNRLYKRFQVAELKTTLAIKKKEKIHRSTQKTQQTQQLSRLRSNSSIKLPTLQRAQLLTQKKQKGKTLITQITAIDTSQNNNFEQARIKKFKHISMMSTKKQNNKNLPTNDAITYLLKIGGLTIPKIIVLLRASENQQFLYLKINGDYEYEAVDFQNKGTNYMTLSAKGILFQNELISMERWMKQESIFFKLKKIAFWKNYLKLKVLTHWKNEMKKHSRQIICYKVIRYSPFTHHTTRLQIFKMRDQFLKIQSDNHVFNLNILKICNFVRYKQIQQQWNTKFIEKMTKKEKKIQSMLNNACFEIVKQYPIQIQNKSQLNKLLMNIDNLTVRFDIKASLKISFQKLYKVIRMTDLMFSESLAYIVITGIKDITKMITNKTEIYNQMIKKLRNLSLIIPKDEFIKLRDEILSEIQYNPWINFELKIDNQNKLKLTPTLDELHSFFQQHWRIFIKSITRFKKPLIQNQNFDFIRNNIVMHKDKNQPPLYTFNQFLSNSTEFIQTLQQSEHIMNTFQQLYQERLNILLPFVNLYNKYQNKENMPEFNFDQINGSIQQIRNDVGLLERLNQGEYIIYGYVNHTQLKIVINNKILKYKSLINHYIPQKFHKEMIQIANILQKHLKNLDILVNSVKNFVFIIKQLTYIYEKIAQYQFQLDQLKKIAIIFQSQFKQTLKTDLDVTNMVIKIKNKMTNYQANKDTNFIKYKKQIIHMIKQLQIQTIQYEQKLSQKIFYQFVDPAQLVYKQLCIINQQLKIKYQKLLEINSYEQAMTLNMTRNIKLQYLIKQFKILKRIWEVIHQWQNLLKRLSSQQILEINLNEVLKAHENYLSILNSQLKNKQKFELGLIIKKQITSFQGLIELLSNFQQKSLRQKDWQEIQKLVKNKLNQNVNLFNNPFSQNLNLTYIINNNIISLQTQIAEICVKAKKQIEIQSMLEKFESWWLRIRLQTQVYDNSSYLFIFTENEQVRREIQQNMMMLLTIMNNKYGGFARNQCNNYLRNLNNLIRLLEELLIHQENFSQLYPILNSSFCEKQLPNEYKKYQNILNTTMKQMKVLINPVKGLNQNTIALLSSNNKQFQNIQKNLVQFLEKKRLVFQRFYFLQDRQMMQLLAGLTKDTTLSRMFQGINGWYKQNQNIVGVIGVGGQIFRLKNLNFRFQQLEIIFKNLEQSIKFTLKSIVKQALNSYEIQLKNLRDITKNIPWMCTNAIQWIIYCKQIQLNYLYNQNNLSLQIQLLSTNLNQLLCDPLRNSNLITLALHMINLTKELQHFEVNNIFNYHWQSVLRFYLEDQIVIRSLGGVYQWGSQYQGLYQVMVNTKDVRRAYCSVLGGLNWGIGVAMQGPSGTGKTQTLKQLARSMGKFCLVFNCSNLINIKLLQKLLSGLCYTASWLCLDELNRLQIEVMSVVAGQINIIKNGVVAHKQKINFVGKQIILKTGIGIFSTMNPNYKNRTQLTENLKQYFRFVCLNIPEYQRIIEVMLYSRGFKDSLRLAKKVCKTYQLLSLHFNQEKHFDFGLRGMKSLMQLIDKELAQKQNQDLLVKKTLYQNIKPRLQQRDIFTFTKILQDMFPGIIISQSINKIFEQKYKSLKDAIQVGTIILGQTSCKSELIKRYYQQTNCIIKRFNPNSLGSMALLGRKTNSGWQTGIVEEIIKQSVNNTSKKYILHLDGKIKSQWAQNFNTLLDDSKILNLSNGSRIKLYNNFRILFETVDIQMVSPATITRCCLIYVYTQLVKLQQYINHFLDQYYFPKELRLMLIKILSKLSRQDIRAIFKMFPALIPNYLKVKSEGWMHNQILGVQRIIIYLLALQGNYEKIQKHLTKEQTPPKLPVNKFYITFQRYPQGQYINFDASYSKIVWTNFNEIFIPNPTSELCQYLIKKAYEQGESNILFKGRYGIGKTANIYNSVRNIKQNFTFIEISITKDIQSNNIIKSIQDKYQVVRQNNSESYIPQSGSRALILIENLALGKQQPKQFLRTFLQTSQFMEVKSFVYRKIKNYSMIAEINKPIEKRISQHFFSIQNQMNKQIKFDTYIKLFTFTIDQVNFATSIKNQFYSLALEKFVKVLINYSTLMNDQFPKYLFSIKQLSKIAYSAKFMNNQKIVSSQSVIEYFIHQIQRIYNDRLLSHEELEKSLNYLKKCFVDLSMGKYKDQFQSIATQYQSKYIKSKYNINKSFQNNIRLKEKQLNIYIPEYLYMHILRIYRMSQIPYTNMILIGEQGLGKKTIVQLTANALDFKIKIPPKNLNDQQSRKFLFSCIKACSKQQKQIFFIINQSRGNQNLLINIEKLVSGKVLYTLFLEQDNDYAYDHIIEVFKTNYDKKNKEYEKVVSDFIQYCLRWIKFIFIVTKNSIKQIQNYPNIMSYSYINDLNQWPESALIEVTKIILNQKDNKSINLHKQKLITLFFEAFCKIRTQTQTYQKLTYKKIHISPIQYLKFIKTYLNVLQQSQYQLTQQQQKLSKSILKMNQTQVTLHHMKNKIIQMEPQLQNKKKSLQKLIPGLQSKRLQSKENKIIVQKDQKQVEMKKLQIQNLKYQAQQSLKQAQPLLTEAAQSVSTIKRSHLSEIKSNNNPHRLVIFTLENVSLLLGDSTSWDSIKKILSDIELSSRLKNCQPKYQDYLKVKKRIEQKSQWTLENLQKISSASKSLAKWIINVCKYCQIHNMIQIKKSNLNSLKKQLIQSQFQLKYAKQKYQSVNNKLDQIQNQYKNTNSIIQNLEKQIALNKMRLSRAEKLQHGLADSLTRWQNMIPSLQLKFTQQITNSLFTAAILSFTPPFPTDYRNQYLNYLIDKAKGFNLQYSESYNFFDIFNTIQKHKWHQKGLASDETSLQNAIFLKYHIKQVPIMLDPDNQATLWLQKSYQPLYTFTKGSFFGAYKQIEKAIRGGHILVMLIDSDFDELLQNLIDAKIEMKGSRKMIEVMKNFVEVHDDYRLILAQKNRIHKLQRKKYVKYPVINFEVTKIALQQQLILQILKEENQQLYNKKMQIQITRAQNKNKLIMLQTQIINSLINSKIGILDDQDLINLLNQSKETASNINQSQTSLFEQGKVLEKYLINYKKLCEEAALIYINLNNLAKINPMLNYSYDSYIKIFLNACIQTISFISNIQEQQPADNSSILYESFIYSAGSVYNSSRPPSSISRLSSKLSSRSRQLLKQEQQIIPEAGDSLINDEVNNNIYKKISRIIDENKKGDISEDRIKKIIKLILNKLKIGLSQKERKIFGLIISISKFQKNDLNLLINTKTIRKTLQEYIDKNEVNDQIKNFNTEVGTNSEYINKLLNSVNPFVNSKLSSFSCLLLFKLLKPDRFNQILEKYLEKEGFGQLIVSSQLKMIQLFQNIDNTHPLLFIMGQDPITKITDFLAKKKHMKNTLVISMGQGQNHIFQRALQKQSKRQTILILHNLHITPSAFQYLSKTLQQFELYPPNPKFRLILIMKPTREFPTNISNKSFKVIFETPSGIKNKMLSLIKNNYQMIDAQNQESKCIAYSIALLHSVISNRNRFSGIGWNNNYQFTDMEFQNSIKILKQNTNLIENPNVMKCNIDDFEDIDHQINYDALRYLIGQINYQGRISDQLDREKMKVLTKAFITQDIHKQNFRYMDCKGFKVPQDLSYYQLIKHIQQINNEDSSIFGLHNDEKPTSSYPNFILNQIESIYQQINESNEDIEEKQKTFELVSIEHQLQFIQKEIENSIKYNRNNTKFLKQISVNTKIFDLQTFHQPKNFFTSIKKNYAVKNNINFDSVTLVFTFSSKEDSYGICNLQLQGGKILNGILQDAHFSYAPIIYIIPNAKIPQNEKSLVNQENKVKIPLYKNKKRQGEINSFGENTNLIYNISIASKRNQQFWILRGTAFICNKYK